MVKGTTTRSPTLSRWLSRPDLDDLAHELMAENVALFHRRDVAAVDVQVRAADGGRGDFDDGVAWIQDRRIGNGLDADVFLAVIADRFHRGLLQTRSG